MQSDYAKAVETPGISHIHSKALNKSLYKFHPTFQKVLSESLCNFDTKILSKEQEALITEYFEAADKIPVTSTNVEIRLNLPDKLNQLDVFLGSYSQEQLNVFNN